MRSSYHITWTTSDDLSMTMIEKVGRRLLRSAEKMQPRTEAERF
jgi:hypothetical protein